MPTKTDLAGRLDEIADVVTDEGTRPVDKVEQIADLLEDAGLLEPEGADQEDDD